MVPGFLSESQARLSSLSWKSLHKTLLVTIPGVEVLNRGRRGGGRHHATYGGRLVVDILLLPRVVLFAVKDPLTPRTDWRSSCVSRQAAVRALTKGSTNWVVLGSAIGSYCRGSWYGYYIIIVFATTSSQILAPIKPAISYWRPCFQQLSRTNS